MNHTIKRLELVDKNKAHQRPFRLPSMQGVILHHRKEAYPEIWVIGLNPKY